MAIMHGVQREENEDVRKADTEAAACQWNANA
jgi:hypothetical protein